MWLTKLSPANRLLDLVDGSLADSFLSPLTEEFRTFDFPVEVVEKKDAYEITAEVPGLSKEDLKISVENNVLTIAGEKKVERKEEHKDHRYHYYERRYGKFSRAFDLGDGVQNDKVEASFKDGVLKLTVQKKDEVKPKAVEIRWE